MRLEAWEEVFQAVRQACDALSTSHKQEHYQSAVDVLSALCVIAPQCRLVVCIATATMRFDDNERDPQLALVENYAITLDDGSLWNIHGPLEMQALEDQTRQMLLDSAQRCQGVLTTPPTVELDRDVKVDAFDPLVMQAVGLLAPQFTALANASRLDAQTPHPARTAPASRL